MCDPPRCRRKPIQFATTIAFALATIGWITLCPPIGEAAPDSVLAPQVSTAIPLAFVSEPGGGFVARTPYGALSLEPGNIRLWLAAGSRGAADVRLVFDGASSTGVLHPGGPLGGVTNYLVGNDPGRWRTGVPTYGSVAYVGLYTGVDLLYEGSASRLKGTYTVSPGVDPDVIRWRYSGADSVAIDDLGHLVISADLWTVRESAPVAWQEVDGRRVPVTVSYRLLDDGSTGFSVGTYDVTRPLVIDPYLVYSTLVGGGERDTGWAVAVDGEGNAYVTGTTWSDDFPTVNALQASRGADDCSSSPCSDAFISKLNAAGDELVFSTYLGGDREENAGLVDVGTRSVGLGIDLDPSGNVYVTGRTFSTDFPVVNAPSPNLTGLTDIFVSKLRPDGRALVFSTYFGGGGAEYSGDIAADASGNAYVTGATLSSDFPIVGGFQDEAGSPGVADAVIVKMNTNAVGPGAVVFSSFLGGDGIDYGFGIEVDGAGEIYVGGHTTSTDFPVVNAFQDTNVAAQAGNPIPRMAFAARVLADGSAIAYGTYLGGTGDDVGYDIDINDSGHIFLTGRTFSDDLPVRQPWQARRGASSSDVMVARIDPFTTGDASLVYCTYAGGAGTDFAYGIAVDDDDNAHVTGATSGITAEGFPIGTVIGPNGTGEGVLALKLGPHNQRWVPVGSRADGANNSIWRTALGLLNVGDTTATVEVILHKEGSFSSTFSIPAGRQVILEDIVGQLGASGSGAIEVLSDRDVKVSSRTYNLISGAVECFPMGTFGQNLDAIATTDALGDATRALLPQLVENDTYRSNIALTNTGLDTAHVEVSLFDGSGRFLASYEVDVPPGRWVQRNRPFFTEAGRDDLDRGYAEIYVPSGFGVIATASVIDAITNDPTTITMLDKDLAGLSTSWFQVASHANGANGSRWRTDLGLLNRGFEVANVSVRLHSGGAVHSSTLQVEGRDQSILADVLGQIPFTGSGALEVVSDQPLFTSSRTYNQIASGAQCLPNGTLGQNLDSHPAGGGLANGETAWLTQLTENGAFRTNIAATNTGSGTAIVRITLFGPDGEGLVEFDMSVPEGEWRQENRPLFTRAGRDDLAAASARAEVIQGSGVIVSASVVDNITNDPTTLVAIGE